MSSADAATMDGAPGVKASRWSAAAPPTFLLTVAFELCVAVASIAIGLSEQTPRDLPFFERDPTISRALVPSTVTTNALVGLAVIMPAASLLVYFVVAGVRQRKSLAVGCGAAAVVLTSFFLAVAMTILTTNVIKNFVGRKRPNFLAKCDYNGQFAAAASSGNFSAYLASTSAAAFGSLSKCAGSADNIIDGQRSFPSGHSSMSFAGLGFLALAARFAFQVDRNYFSPTAILASLPLALATYIACTRLIDGYHNFDDVLAGAVIGSFFASISWAHYIRSREVWKELNVLTVGGPTEVGLPK